MIEILSAPDHVVALRMAGTVNAADFDRVVDAVEAKLKGHRKIGIYADIADLDDITAEAASKDIRYSLSKFDQWERFPREAVITDKQWVRALASVADALVPQVELRTFAPEEREQALAWVSAAPS